MTPRLFPSYSDRTPIFVLDVAVVAAWLLHNRASQYTVDVQWRLMKQAAIVPSVWFPCLADLFLAAERIGATTRSKIDAFLSGLPSFPIFVDDETEYRAWGNTLDVARSHGITVSDAAYLELALRLNLPLATIDPALTRAAASVGVPLFTP